MTLLLKSFPARAEVWARVFQEAGEPILLDPDAVADPAEVTVLACWQPPEDLSIYPNLRAVLSVGAGVDQMPALPPHLYLCRSLADSIETSVRDWVLMACLMAHREIPAYLSQARTGTWTSRAPSLSRHRRIGILGLGRIGKLVAKSLTELGFPVLGWSRSGAPVECVEVYGERDLTQVLNQSDILVCLLPLTPQTRNLLNAKSFAALPDGAHLVHAGRGAQLSMEDMRAALDTGKLASAILDVTNPEPLPADHWAWQDPRLIITPHIASETDAEEGAQHALAVWKAVQAGQIPPGLVDRDSGY